MTKHIRYERMRFKLEFGKNEPTGKKNPNTGKAIKGFQPHFTKWAGLWTLNQTQQITLAGAGIKNAVVFFVRHDEKVTSDLLIRKTGNIYVIDSIADDDGTSPDGFDLITCHRDLVNHG